MNEEVRYKRTCTCTHRDELFRAASWNWALEKVARRNVESSVLAGLYRKLLMSQLHNFHNSNLSLHNAAWRQHEWNLSVKCWAFEEFSQLTSWQGITFGILKTFQKHVRSKTAPLDAKHAPRPALRVERTADLLKNARSLEKRKNANETRRQEERVASADESRKARAKGKRRKSEKLKN